MISSFVQFNFREAFNSDLISLSSVFGCFGFQHTWISSLTSVPV